MESDLARIGTNCLTLLIIGFMGWILYIKVIKEKSFDFSAIVGKFNLRGRR